MSELTEVWFEEVKKLDVGQSLFFRVTDPKEQTTLANEFEKEKELYAEVDPVHASQIFILKSRRELKYYVVLERKYRAVFTAFLKDADGVWSKVTIDPERKRLIVLMLKDRKSREEIEDAVNGLTEEESAEFFPEI